MWYVKDLKKMSGMRWMMILMIHRCIHTSIYIYTHYIYIYIYVNINVYIYIYINVSILYTCVKKVFYDMDILVI